MRSRQQKRRLQRFGSRPMPTVNFLLPSHTRRSVGRGPFTRSELSVSPPKGRGETVFRHGLDSQIAENRTTRNVSCAGFLVQRQNPPTIVFAREVKVLRVTNSKLPHRISGSAREG